LPSEFSATHVSPFGYSFHPNISHCLGVATAREIGGVICPTGWLVIFVSSPAAKNIPLSTLLKSALEPAPSHPDRGAYRDRHGRGVGCGGRGSVGAQMESRGGLFRTCERITGAQTNGACRGRRSRVVLTPRRWRQVSRRCNPPNRAVMRHNPRRRRWQKSPVTGESAKEAVKTIAQGKLGVPLTCGNYTRVLPTLHTRLRVQRAPGFPCSLCIWRDLRANLGHIAPRECALMCEGRGGPIGQPI
jgi:hypothetical protein